MKKRIALIAAAVAMISQPVFSQMMKPGFSPELARLSFIVGHFTTRTLVMVGDTASNGSGTIHAHWGLDSMFVMYSSAEKNAALGSYKGFGVLGYNSNDRQYVLSMYNNFGDRPEYKGNFVGDTLTMTAEIETPQGHFNQQLKWYKDDSNVRLLVFSDFGHGYSLVVDQAATPSAESEKEMQKK